MLQKSKRNDTLMLPIGSHTADLLTNSYAVTVGLAVGTVGMLVTPGSVGKAVGRVEGMPLGRSVIGAPVSMEIYTRDIMLSQITMNLLLC